MPFVNLHHFLLHVLSYLGVTLLFGYFYLLYMLYSNLSRVYCCWLCLVYNCCWLTVCIIVVVLYVLL